MINDEIIKRTLRDTYDNDTKNVYIEGNDAYQKAKKFIQFRQYQDASILYSSILKQFPLNQKALQGLTSIKSLIKNHAVSCDNDINCNIQNFVSQYKQNNFQNVLTIGKKLLEPIMIQMHL